MSGGWSGFFIASLAVSISTRFICSLKCRDCVQRTTERSRICLVLLISNSVLLCRACVRGVTAGGLLMLVSFGDAAFQHVSAEILRKLIVHSQDEPVDLEKNAS